MTQLQFFKTALSTTASPTWREAMDVLENFCTEVQTVTQQGVTCTLLPGFTTNLGQEYRVTVHSNKKSIDHILFRAHVPANGLPLYLDLYDDQMRECKRLEELIDALAEFARRDVTRETLRLLSQ